MQAHLLPIPEPQGIFRPQCVVIILKDLGHGIKPHLMEVFVMVPPVAILAETPDALDGFNTVEQDSEQCTYMKSGIGNHSW